MNICEDGYAGSKDLYEVKPKKKRKKSIPTKEKITQMEEKIKEQAKEIDDLLKAIKEYERGQHD